MRTTLDLPDPLFRELKAESALRGMKLKDLVAELLRRGLSPRVPMSAKRSDLPVIRQATGAVHPALSNREIENLLTEEDAHGGD